MHQDAADANCPGGLQYAQPGITDEDSPKAPPRLREIDGLTPSQRFFVGTAQWACSNDRPEDLRIGAVTDPHSPARYRVNGLVVNMPEFAQAFSCKAGKKLVKKKPEDICKVW